MRPGSGWHRAAVLLRPKTALQLRLVPTPTPAARQVLIKVSACGVCRTDLHVQDGDLPQAVYEPNGRVLGHEIVGRVHALGPGVSSFKMGDKVGVPWLASTDMTCQYCRDGKENLCEAPAFTGCTVDGGMQEFALAHESFCFAMPDDGQLSDADLAPFLCAGLIGYRTLKLSGGVDSPRPLALGLYGFGAAASILSQVAKALGHSVYAFTRQGDVEAQRFAVEKCGCTWAGDSESRPPVQLDAALIFAPVGALVVEGLKSCRKGGVVCCGGIHMSDIPAFPYSLLWEERTVKSVANLTRADGVEFFALLRRLGGRVKTHVTTYPLERVNEAIEDVRQGRITGAAVIVLE